MLSGVCVSPAVPVAPSGEPPQERKRGTTGTLACVAASGVAVPEATWFPHAGFERKAKLFQKSGRREFSKHIREERTKTKKKTKRLKKGS